MNNTNGFGTESGLDITSFPKSQYVSNNQTNRYYTFKANRTKQPSSFIFRTFAIMRSYSQIKLMARTWFFAEKLD